VKSSEILMVNDMHAASPQRRFGWVPIRSLAPRHRPRILTHLQALSPNDRYLRFGHVASDAQIEQYVDGLDFDRDEVFGIFNRRLELIAMAHLAFSARGRSAAEAEFGVAVAPRARGRGFGARLFEHTILHARNRGVDTLVVHALAENVAMLRIVRRSGAQIERDGGETEARLRLPPEDLASQFEQAFGDRAAEIDYRLKAGARQVDGWLDALAELRHEISGIRGGNASR
jgi:GNAT superfamily N-acetyltransferase